jgi:hypothetical protein
MPLRHLLAALFAVIATPVFAAPAADCQNLKEQIAHLQQSIAEMKNELAHCKGCNAEQLNNTIKAANLTIQQDQTKIKYGCPPPHPPKPVPPPSTDNGPPGPDINFKVTGIEVTQTVQDIANSVTLVASKQTWVRVYVTKVVDEAPIALKGDLSVSCKALTIGVTSDATVNVGAKASQADERHDATQSFNFLVPNECIQTGSTRFALADFIDPTGHNEFYRCLNCADVVVNVNFSAVPPLRVHVVDLLYQFSPTPGAPLETASPRPIDYTLVQSWLGRDYPVASLEIAHGIGTYDDSDPAPAKLDCDVANASLDAIRASDISSGTDARTHYIGLVSNKLMKMRGCAESAPTTPDPSVVASLPSGAPTDPHRPGDSQNDMDASFADYYAGHELAHTFGRRHPGVCGNNSHDDPAFPYPNGQISDGSDTSYFGFDIGDKPNGIPRAVLPGTTTFDLMTYCHQPRWLSPYAYEGIRQRLIDENPGFQTGTPSAAPRTPPRPVARTGETPLIHVVALVDPDKRTGSFRYVFPVSRGTAIAASDSKAALVAFDASGKQMLRQPVALRLSTDAEDTPDPMALVRADLPYREGMSSIVLMLDDTKVAEFRVAGTAPAAVRNLQLQPRMPSTPAIPSNSRRLSWIGAANATYIVETSADGRNWNTIAVGIRQPQLALSSEHARTRFARVTATDGFHRSAATSIAFMGR